MQLRCSSTSRGGACFNNTTTTTTLSVIITTSRHRSQRRLCLHFVPPPDNKLAMSPESCKVSRRRKKTSLTCQSSSSTVSPLPSPPPQNSPESNQREGSDLQTLARRFWKVAAPYWYSDDDKKQARLQLAAVFALTFATTGISVGFNFLGRDFYNALSNKDQEQFTKQLIYYLASFAGGIPIFVLRDYARDTLALRWRSWMTTYYMERYLKDQTFYQIQSQSIIDNPDQRIVDDLSSFTGIALSFSLTLFNAAVDLVSFSNILLGIYPPLFVVLLVYSIGGTAISVFLGRGLVTLNFLQEKKEADFRYGLVRVRENAESIAFYGGEENELQLLLQRFRSAFENLTQLLISSRNLEFFTSGYRYLIQILPAAVVAPMYFSGKIDFGVINQSVSAFNHILGDFSLIVFQFQSISAFSAVIDRLGEFDDVLDSKSSKSSEDPSKGIQLTYDNVKKSTLSEVNGSISLDESEKLLDIENLTVLTPTNSVLVKDLSLQINEKDHLLITGPSGSGKTSLLRAIAGLWGTGKGSIKFYGKNSMDSSIPDRSDSNPPRATTPSNSSGNLERPNSRGVFFLPQRPYMVLGTLRQQLLYPTWTDESAHTPDDTKSAGSLSFLMRAAQPDSAKVKSQKPTTDELIQVLKDVRIEYILSRFSLDSTCEWSSVLSLGEQQRLAFARLLLSKPYLVLLDESTSALDEDNEVPLNVTSETLPERPGVPDCPYFLKTQRCKFGPRCKFNHPQDKIAPLAALGSVDVSVLPERPSEPPCAFYTKTGTCKFGATCKFHHPKDIVIPSAGQNNGSGYTGSVNSAVIEYATAKPVFTPALLQNSKGLPVRPGEVDCPFYLKTGSCKYGATCRYNHPDRYAINPPAAAAAFVASPAAHLNIGLNPSASILQSFDPRLTQASLGLVPTIYPQRPGQIECDFYMKSGACMFGETCKYHHPIDRSAQAQYDSQQQNLKFTPAGLPRREGAINCPYYMKTGACKYGIACKFDHPPAGEGVSTSEETATVGVQDGKTSE